MRKGRDFPILWEDILLATLLLLLEQPAQHQVNPPWIFISWNLLIYSVRREPYLLHTLRIAKPLSHSFLLWNFLQQRPDRFLTSLLAFPFTRLYNNIPPTQPHQWRFLAISHYSTRRLMTALHKYKLLATCHSNIRMFQYSRAPPLPLSPFVPLLYEKNRLYYHSYEYRHLTVLCCLM